MDKWEQVYIHTLERPVFYSPLQICFLILAAVSFSLFCTKHTSTKLQVLFQSLVFQKNTCPRKKEKKDDTTLHTLFSPSCCKKKKQKKKRACSRQKVFKFLKPNLSILKNSKTRGI